MQEKPQPGQDKPDQGFAESDAFFDVLADQVIAEGETLDELLGGGPVAPAAADDEALGDPDGEDDGTFDEPDLAYVYRRFPWSEAFFKALRNSGNVRIATSMAGISRQVAYHARRNDPHFAAAWEMAMEEATDTLEAMARHRAMRQSDTLMIFLLKANRPEKYTDTARLELTSKVDVTKLNDEQLVKLINAGGKLPPGAL
jgi:hypothetical protein